MATKYQDWYKFTVKVEVFDKDHDSVGENTTEVVARNAADAIRYANKESKLMYSEAKGRTCELIEVVRGDWTEVAA